MLQEEQDSMLAHTLWQAELSPLKPKRKASDEAAIASTGKDGASAHCLSPEGTLGRETRRMLGY